ncbi:hypothetical protein [Leuconostoc gelidum]|uniref:hypothetical protein n=1 Tax=Leuconostoc gelidum TaxID=1244 RepID=UPI001CC6AB24|nr:hypothetical protein [Leuconostoc gelidum]MBZ6000936.1 hypothetical protein [Leuconostoc gelidum subsp. gelidum]
MNENVKHIVKNVTCNTYVESYDSNRLKETTDIISAKRYKDFKKSDNVAIDLTDDECIYKAIGLIVQEEK